MEASGPIAAFKAVARRWLLPSAMPSQCCGPRPAKAIVSALATAGRSGSMTPQYCRIASRKAASWPLRACSVASPRSARSVIVTWLPGGAGAASANVTGDDDGLCSAMEPRSLWIDEDRRDELDLGIAVAHRIIGAHAFAVSRRSTLDEGKADPMPERR